MMVFVQKYGGTGGTWNDLFVPEGSVYQLQIDHVAYPSILFRFLDSFREFITAEHASNAEFPDSLPKWEERYTSKVVLTSKGDPDGVGRVQWRLAIYVSPNMEHVREIIKILDSFTVYQTKNAKDLKFSRIPKLEILLGQGVTLADFPAGDMECPWNIAAWGTVMSRFPKHVEADAPTVTKRGLLVSLEFAFTGKTNIVWGGDTYLFRAHFEAAEIPGQYDDDDPPQFFRVLQDHNIETDEGIEEVVALFGERVLQYAAVACTIEGDEPEDDTQGAKLVAALGALPNVCFYGAS